MRHLSASRFRRWCLVLWCLGWVLVSVALLMPVPTAVPQGSDLVVHGLMFAGMALAAASFCRHALWLALPALFTLGAGIGLEWAQGLVPYRTFDQLDAVANAAGAALGYLVAVLLLLLWSRGPSAALGRSDAASP